MNLIQKKLFRPKTCAPVLLALLTTLYANGGERPQRSRVIDFEDGYVEGMNRRPLDSLNQIGESEKDRGRAHLYRRRGGFRDETRETLHEARYRG